MAKCEKPIFIRNNSVTRGGIHAPCGRCYSCIARKTSNMSFRLMQQDKVSQTSYFLTLTYADNKACKTRNGYMVLHKKHIQDFFKKVRRVHDRRGKLGLEIKYFAVGEYGGKFARPHYHAIIFNLELDLFLSQKQIKAIKSGVTPLDGKFNYQIKQWEYGHITVGQVSGASIGYTLKYLSKPSRIPMHRNDDRIPEFTLSSNGLGLAYLTKAMIAWHKADPEKRQYCTTEQGLKISMPRYYKLKIHDIQERENLRAWNALEQMKVPKAKENTARQRSEAFYAGIDRKNKQYTKNQKL